MRHLNNHLLVVRLVNTLQEKGFSACIAGGAVRDVLLGRIPADFDILTSAGLEEIRSLFAGEQAKIAGKAFPVCIVNGVEISPLRNHSDSGTGPDSAGPDDPDHKLSLVPSDLGQRDFTINAMAYDPFSKTFLDPYGGRQDLEKRMIRFTGDPGQRIQEDPVRMIRACRFSALIDAEIEPDSLKAIEQNTDCFDQDLAEERIRLEIVKAMLLEKPSLFFRKLYELKLLEKIFPSLSRCHDLDGGPHHGETVFEHCMMTGDAVSPRYPLLRLAGYLHDAGKFDAAVIKEGALSFPAHEKYTGAVTKDLENLRFSGREIEYIRSVIRTHMRPLKKDSTPKAVRRLLAMLEAHHIDYRDFMRMRIADKKSNLNRNKPSYTMAQIKERLAKLFDQMAENIPTAKEQLNISGNDIKAILSIEAGPEIGRIKEFLFQKVLDHPEQNNYADLKKLCLQFKTDT